MHVLRLYLLGGQTVTLRTRDEPELGFTPAGKLEYVRYPNPEITSLDYVNVDQVTLVRSWQEGDDEDDDDWFDADDIDDEDD